MNKLQIPLQSEAVKSIFLKCISNYRDSNKRDILKRQADNIEISADNYLKMMPYDFESFSRISISEVEAELLKDVYRDKFVNEKRGGYYNIIMHGAGGICPFCGIGTPTTLDHYLPKADYPLLSVTPVNLIPACKDCNTNKGEYSPTCYSELIIHPYLEEIDYQWLNARISFISDGTAAINYYVDKSMVKDNDMYKRLNCHFNKCKLQKNYEGKFSSELYSNEIVFRNIMKKGCLSINEYIEDMYSGAYKVDKNSWKTGMYYALKNQLDEFVSWLS